MSKFDLNNALSSPADFASYYMLISQEEIRKDILAYRKMIIEDLDFEKSKLLCILVAGMHSHVGHYPTIVKDAKEYLELIINDET